VKKALITGIAGFAGSHLAELLLQQGWEVSGLDREGVNRRNLEEFVRRLILKEVDILDSRAVEEAVRELEPDLVFHLAGVAYVPHAQHNPAFVFDVNAKGTLNLLRACQHAAPAARLVLISSSQIYGKARSSRIPLTEVSPPRPANVYALSKLCAEEAALLYHREEGLDLVILRPFNHIGPRQDAAFVVADFSRQIARIEAGAQEAVIKVGNLSSSRDFTDVRDMVRGYSLAAEKGVSGQIYNLSSGIARRIEEIVRRLLEKTDKKVEIMQENKRLREGEISIICGDCEKFRKQTGWEIRFDLDRSLDDVLNYWRKNVPREKH
jgi:GDP-4-dehydro-6-deoxy-D-mannose reductase